MKRRKHSKSKKIDPGVQAYKKAIRKEKRIVQMYRHFFTLEIISSDLNVSIPDIITVLGQNGIFTDEADSLREKKIRRIKPYLQQLESITSKAGRHPIDAMDLSEFLWNMADVYQIVMAITGETGIRTSPRDESKSQEVRMGIHAGNDG